MAGSSASLICQECSNRNPLDARFCQNCGTVLSRVCPECATENTSEARFCKNCGTSLASGGPGKDSRLASLQQSAPQGIQEKMRAASASLDGERKPVTILFADIVGSTSIAEALDPEEWKEVVAGAHQRFGEAIYRYEGTIAQLLGDGVLAFFGAPLTHEDDPIRAVRAALDIQGSVGLYARELAGYVDDFHIRIGINSGTVVIGDIGTDLHVEYLALGDAVNIAARLQSAAEPGNVLISDSTARLIGDDFDIEDRGDIALKGKTEPLHSFVVLGTSGIPEVRRGIPGRRAPYVGRAEELEKLHTALRALREGHGQIMTVLGEPGIGKSRMLEEVRTHADEKNGASIRWLEGRALSYGQSLSFWPITQLLMSDLGLSDGAPDVKLKVALRKRMDELFGEEATGSFMYLAHLLGLAEHLDVGAQIRSLDGETVKRQTLLSLTEYFRQAAERQPTVLILEDLHWADPSSLEALARLLPLTGRHSLMIIMLMRVERDHRSWRLKLDTETDFHEHYTELNLAPLTDDEADQLVKELLGAEGAEEIRELIRSRVSGNPLYMEEIVQHLIERGLIERVNGSWSAAGAISGGGVPETLEGILLARIDRLEPGIRNTLQLASVIGRTFPYRVLEAISETGRELEWHLTQLQQVDLVWERARHPEQEYMFKHALTQEAAYNSLLHERRKDYHGKVGLALEQLFADRVEEFLGLLAHHFDVGEDRGKALNYLIRAGDKARLEDALTEALDYYARALQIHADTGDIVGEANTWLKIGLVHLRDFDFDSAHDAHEAAFELQQTLKSKRLGEAAHEDITKEQTAVLRLAIVFEDGSQRVSLDPAKTALPTDEQAIRDCFAGLTEVDAEMNVVPHVARSWEVFDEGTRYVFHLRDDVFWTDGEQVTAEDFRYSLLRNLSPDGETLSANFLDAIVGAREYREGRSNDPESVAVRVLDRFTLEVRLGSPVPYFIYLTANSVSFPVPRHIVERHGEAWSQANHIVTNGPFRVRKLDEESAVWIRNPIYFGDFTGNIHRYEHLILQDYSRAIDSYSEGQVDVVWDISFFDLPADLPIDLEREEIGRLDNQYSTMFLIFNPLLPPLDDIRLRKALAHAIDRGRSSGARLDAGFRAASGGIIPRGMPGHSPEIGYTYDRSKAAQYLEDAGYPNGKGLPTLFLEGILLSQFQEFVQQWKDGFGIDPQIRQLSLVDYLPRTSKTNIYASAWIADYPDPDSFLRTSLIHDFLVATGWSGIARCDDLLNEALRSQERMERLEIYRKVDRLLVEEEALVVPLKYRAGRDLVKPWIRRSRADAMGYVRRKETFIEPH